MKMEDRIARWRSEEVGYESESSLDLLCEAEEELRQLRVKADLAYQQLNILRHLKELRDAAKAYRSLSVCYRTGRRPSEKLHKALSKAGQVLARKENS